MQKLGTYEVQSLDKKKPDTFDPDQHRKYRYGDKEIETTR